MGAISACSLNLNGKVALDKAIPANVEMVVSVIKGRHGSAIAGAGSVKLADEAITSGIYIQIIGKVKRICYDKMIGADKAIVDRDIAAIEKAIKESPKK